MMKAALSSLSIGKRNVTEWEGTGPKGHVRSYGDGRVSRVRLWRIRRAASQAECKILSYPFPTGMVPRLVRHHPTLSISDSEVIEQGLREWFICCAWRGEMALGL